jgi:hypothetical protein
MTEHHVTIAGFLSQVDDERLRRQADPELHAAVQALKIYQQARFSRTYADLLATPRYGSAAKFFLEELYGPTDFTRRDAQFLRVAPAISRLFPSELVHAVAVLAELHAVSEQLDTAMGEQLRGCRIDANAYVRAWQSATLPAKRELQIALTLEIGATLDRYTRKPLIRQTLRMMRGPARAAGLGELQRFLEAGFDAFKAMKGATEFLSLIGQRERTLAHALFGAPLPVEAPVSTAANRSVGDLTTSLP